VKALCGACHAEAELNDADFEPDAPGWQVDRESSLNADGELVLVAVAKHQSWKCPVPSCQAINEVQGEL